LEQEGAPQGIMALTGDMLLAPTFSLKGTQAYRKKDGQKLDWYKKPRSFWIFGSEAIADGDVYFFGGARHGNDDHKSRPSCFNLMDIQSGWLYGPETFNKPKPIAPVCVAPVLGKQTIVGDGAGYDRSRYQSSLQKDPSQTESARIWSLRLWPDGVQKTTALALAGDVVLIGGTSEVAAFEAKAEGKELSRVNIPGRVLRNGLAVSSGAVFVATEEGSICCLNGIK
jgi:hypothetical protein